MTDVQRTAKVYKEIEKNVEFLKDNIGADVSFDVVFREFKIGDKKAALSYIDAFGDDQIITLIMATGSLHNPQIVQQKLTIPTICHAVAIESGVTAQKNGGGQNG